MKDRTVKSDREWSGLAEEENLMGEERVQRQQCCCQSDLSSVCLS